MKPPTAGLTVTGVLGGVSFIITFFLRIPSGMDNEIKFVAVTAAVAGSIVSALLRNTIKRPYLILAVIVGLIVFFLSFIGYVKFHRDSAGCENILCSANVLLLCTIGIFFSFSFILALGGVRWLSPPAETPPGGDGNSGGGD